MISPGKSVDVPTGLVISRPSHVVMRGRIGVALSASRFYLLVPASEAAGIALALRNAGYSVEVDHSTASAVA